MKPVLRTAQVLICIAVPLFIGWVMRCAVDWEGPDTPGVIFTVAAPFYVSFLAALILLYVAPLEKVRRIRYRLFRPWPLGIFFGIVLICIDSPVHFAAYAAAALPLSMAAASMGGLTGGYFRLREKKVQNGVQKRHV